MLKTLILSVAPRYLPNLIRQAGLLAAGGLLQVGIIGEGELELVAGAVVAIGMGSWAILEKKGLLAKLLA
jgi:hypothetical protein